MLRRTNRGPIAADRTQTSVREAAFLVGRQVERRRDTMLWCNCGNCLGEYRDDGKLYSGVIVSRTKRARVFIDPPAIQCDSCGAIWHAEQKAG